MRWWTRLIGYSDRGTTGKIRSATGEITPATVKPSRLSAVL